MEARQKYEERIRQQQQFRVQPGQTFLQFGPPQLNTGPTTIRPNGLFYSVAALNVVFLHSLKTPYSQKGLIINQAFLVQAPSQQRQQSQQGPCVDRSRWCTAWLQRDANVCRTSQIYMRNDCPRSCGYC